MDDFCVKLKPIRMNKGLTQRQLAKRSGLSLDAIRALEQGIRRPSAATRGSVFVMVLSTNRAADKIASTGS